MQVRIIVYGLVQGVFFRHTARQMAEKLGLVGWVRNNDDGSVEALAQGPRGKLEEFVAWCRRGPPAAEVEKVETEWSEGSGQFDNFNII